MPRLGHQTFEWEGLLHHVRECRFMGFFESTLTKKVRWVNRRFTQDLEGKGDSRRKQTSTEPWASWGGNLDPRGFTRRKSVAQKQKGSLRGIKSSWIKGILWRNQELRTSLEEGVRTLRPKIRQKRAKGTSKIERGLEMMGTLEERISCLKARVSRGGKQDL